MPNQIKNFDDLPDEGFVVQGQLVPARRTSSVSVPLPFSASTLWRLIRAGKFPAPSRFPGSSINVWQVSEIRAFLRSARK